ncbi:uncharacterized protein LOC127565577 [Drosophila albomicans]|uniref:Uncharacterized protein LOC127565577 n=1 Tax=Drosophila albomicans TaxID=7291 RepID=A0A9C6T618_DROAB|nr:uncharacterized protein LOC127565577 [Drosophila albomicans]
MDSHSQAMKKKKRNKNRRNNNDSYKLETLKKQSKMFGPREQQQQQLQQQEEPQPHKRDAVRSSGQFNLRWRVNLLLPLHATVEISATQVAQLPCPCSFTRRGMIKGEEVGVYSIEQPSDRDRDKRQREGE